MDYSSQLLSSVVDKTRGIVEVSSRVASGQAHSKVLLLVEEDSKASGLACNKTLNNSRATRTKIGPNKTKTIEANRRALLVK